MIINKLKMVFIILVTSSLFFLNLEAGDSFEARILIKETMQNGEVIYEINENIDFSNNSLNKKVKNEKMIEKIIKRIIVLEAKYKDTDLFFVESLEDDKKNIWTISAEVTSNDTSVTQFVAKVDDKIISGWINRNNKDIFGLRIFNF